MEGIIKHLTLLKEKTEEWKELLSSFAKDNMESTEEYYDDIYSLISEMRELYKTENCIPDGISAELDDPELKKQLDDYIRDSLKWFFDLKILREIQLDYPINAANVIDIIMNETVIYIGTNGIQRAREELSPVLPVEEDLLESLSSALSFFMVISIKNNATVENMSKGLQINGGISTELSDQIATIIWDNRIELKLDYIINGLINTEK